MYTCDVTGRTYDPIKCVRCFHIYSGGKINEWLDSVEDWQTQDRLVKLVRQVFNLPDYDDATKTGYPDADVLQSFDNFTEWLAKKE